MDSNTNHTTSHSSTPSSLGREPAAIASGCARKHQRTLGLTRIEHLLSCATYVTTMAAPPPESASPAVEPARPRLAQTQGAWRRRAQERGLSAALLPRPLCAVPV